MGLRFFRRFRIGPGVTLNVSTSGVSVSLGPPGAKVTVGPTGTRATVGLPGTGLYYTTSLGDAPRGAGAALGKADRALLEACDAAERGDPAEALAMAGPARQPDGAFLRGVLRLALGDDPVAAEADLRKAVAGRDRLGSAFRAIGRSPSVRVPIDDDTSAVLAPDALGASLGLVEALQRQGRTDAALRLARRLAREHPDDALVRLSLADLGEPVDGSS